MARAVLDGDPAKLCELLECRLTAEATPATVLDAAEGHRRLIVDGRVVDVAHAGFQAARDGQGGVHVTAEDGRGESVFGVVCDTNRLVDTAHGNDRDDRTERLLRVEPHLRSDIGQDGRFEVKAVRLPAGDHLRPLCDRIVELVGHPPERVLVHKWTDLRVLLARVAHLQRAGPLTKFACELLRYRAIDQDALGRHADLPLVHERAKARRRHGALEIGVGQDDQRRLPAELEEHPLEMSSSRLSDDPSNTRRAREADPPHRWMGNQLLNHLRGVLGIVGDEVDRPLRHVRVLQRVHDRGVCPRALLGCLQDDGVAVRQWRRHSAHAEHDRRVPRCDPDDHPDRLAHRLRLLARDVRRDVLLFRPHVGLVRVVGEHSGAELHVEHAPPDRAVRLLGDQGRDFSLALHQQLRRAPKQAAPLGRRRRRPLRKSSLRRLHRETSLGTTLTVSHSGAAPHPHLPKLMSTHKIPSLRLPRLGRPASPRG